MGATCGSAGQPVAWSRWAASGEADAHLHLPPPSPASVLAEALDEQFAKIDYTVKANVRAAFRWLTPRR